VSDHGLGDPALTPSDPDDTTPLSFESRVETWINARAPHLRDGDHLAHSRSRLPVEPLYTHADLDRLELRPDVDLGLPGEFPFTRGINTATYGEQLWVMGQYSGYGTPKATNERIRSLLDQGQRGFSIALDLPTQLGLDSDHALAVGEVGKVGVPISSVDDMIELLHGIPLDAVRQIRTTANAIGPLAVGLFVVAAEELGYSPLQFKVMLQNDVLKEYVARGTYIFPPAVGLKLSVDVIEYCSRHLSHWEPIEFCGYHIRDAGSDAVQEVAFAIANGFAYIDATLARGLPIDEFGQHFYLFLSTHLDLFEEVAKLRAARRVWARLLRARYGASDESCRLHLFVYTLGSQQTLQEPLNNIVRIGYQALAAVLGGAQTLATSAYDEALQLPSKEAVRVALQTQQILAYETGTALSIDPLAGSYLVESLTSRIEQAVLAKLAEVDALGGALRALETGFISSQIDEEAFRQQQMVEDGTQVVVGVNRFRGDVTEAVRHRVVVDPAVETEQVERLRRLRASRDPEGTTRALAGVRDAALSDSNSVPPIIEALRARATVGEIVSTLKDVWGAHRP
jgi:methylmalonyl-CoA mutase N-terminal domain/subunit